MSDTESVQECGRRLTSLDMIDIADVDENANEESEEWQQELVNTISSNNASERLGGIKALSSRASGGSQFSVLMRSQTAVDALVHSLQPEAGAEFQQEAAQAITNLMSAGARHLHALAGSGAVQALVHLLQFGNCTVQEQSAWALSNIVGEGGEAREIALNAGLFQALCTLLQPETDAAVLDATVMLLMSLFRNREDRVRFQMAMDLLPVMLQLLASADAAPVHHNLLWAMSFLVEESEERCKLVLQEATLSQLMSILKSGDSALLVPALRLYGNLSAAMQPLPTCILADGDLLATMRGLLADPDPRIRRQVLFFVANVSDGPDKHLQLIADAGLLPIVNQILLEANEAEQREAFWIVPNFCITRGFAFKNLVVNNCVEGFVLQLNLQDNEISQCILMTMRDLLNCARYKFSSDMDFNLLKQKLIDCGGLKAIERVQEQSDEDLAKMSNQIMDQFFLGNEAKYLPTSDGFEVSDDLENEAKQVSAANEDEQNESVTIGARGP